MVVWVPASVPGVAALAWACSASRSSITERRSAPPSSFLPFRFAPPFKSIKHIHHDIPPDFEA